MPHLPHAVFLEAEAAGRAHGYRGNNGQHDGWLQLSSLTAPGDIWITARAVEATWYLAVELAPVIAELEWASVARVGPGAARYAAADVSELRQLVQRIYRLAVSLPDKPLLEFKNRTAKLPSTTEAERLVVQRVGQDIFRNRLLDYWDGTCPLTGITDTALLRASHIKPWSACDSDAERLDVHNGLLLSSLWDAAFDAGLVTFDREGRPQFSRKLSANAQEQLMASTLAVSLTPHHGRYLAYHRAHVFHW